MLKRRVLMIVLAACHPSRKLNRRAAARSRWTPNGCASSSTIAGLIISGCPGFRVDWQTGAAIEAWPAGTGAHTHCSAFAASAAMRLASICFVRRSTVKSCWLMPKWAGYGV